MKRLKLYLDTTIWNFSFANDSPQYQADTVEFFKLVRMGLYDLHYSEAVEREAAPAPGLRLAQIGKLMEESSPHRLKPLPEIDNLAKAYLSRAVLPKKSELDALHVAYATYYKMGSWCLGISGI